MSVSDAVLPFFMTWVDSLTLSWSVSWFFDLSSFSTLPVTCELLELVAALPEPIEPLLDDPEPVPMEPDEPLLEEPEPVPREPDESLFDFEGSAGSVADEPELPDDPLPIDPEEPDEPELEEPPLDPAAPLDCAPAGSAMRRPAIPKPATIPLLIFMLFPLCSVERRTRHPAVSRRVCGPHTLVLAEG